MMDININIIGIEPYDEKKYRDDFGSKKNPFRYVAIVETLINGHKLELVLKFIKRPNEKEIYDKSLKLLNEVGIINTY